MTRTPSPRIGTLAATAGVALALATAPAGAQPASSASAAPPPVGPAASAAPATPGDAIAARYVTQCSGCHTIGGGKLKGPDLEASLEWSEASLGLAVKKMTKNVGPLPDGDVAAFVTLLKSPDVRARIAKERARAAAESTAKLAPPDAAVGRALFSGARALERGGLACVACHEVAGAGGTLGPDLTGLATKMDAVGMASAFEQASFAVMREAYRAHPVTRQEAVHLAAYFQSIGPSPARAPSPSAPLALGAIALPGVTFLALFALRRGRREGARARLVRESLRR